MGDSALGERVPDVLLGSPSSGPRGGGVDPGVDVCPCAFAAGAAGSCQGADLSAGRAETLCGDRSLATRAGAAERAAWLLPPSVCRPTTAVCASGDGLPDPLSALFRALSLHSISPGCGPDSDTRAPPPPTEKLTLAFVGAVSP